MTKYFVFSFLALCGLSANARVGADDASEFYAEWCGGRQVDYCTISLGALVARPELFIGQRVSVSGFLRNLHGEWAIFSSLSDACYWQTQSAIEIATSKEGLDLSEYAYLDGGRVHVFGEVKTATEKSHDMRFLLSIQIGKDPKFLKSQIRGASIVLDAPPIAARPSATEPTLATARFRWDEACN